MPFFKVWTGRDSTVGSIQDGFFDGGFINHLGDAVYVDNDMGTNRALFRVEDLTTSVSPDPGTLFLVGTGGLMLVGLLIRRSVGKGKQVHREQCLS